jgi:hypothetical protein
MIGHLVSPEDLVTGACEPVPPSPYSINHFSQERGVMSDPLSADDLEQSGT